ncbi:tail fiber protein [Photobacterium sp. SDRW27]|uniref:phage tail protein n=1 Tax=Photobacterium obscurum TaxID=2829490 RepID=UPI0022434772|nr:tail fiber protein [Photobacterium obscurum]MCW8331525.1 tail fiber protein [Photobacterium obscurum]
MEEMMGSIKLFGGNFAPKDFAFCDGQLIAISQNQALFAILGNVWGGDGRTNFALPDMRGRVPIGVGRGIGRVNVIQAQMLGNEVNALQLSQMPAHSHSATFNPTSSTSSPPTATAAVKANSGIGTENSPAGNYWATGNVAQDRSTYPVEKGFASTADTTMASDAVTIDIAGGSGGITGGSVTVKQTGGEDPFSIMQPSLGINYIMCVEGLFPSRN